MGARERQKKEHDRHSHHEERARKGLERRVPRDEDDHPQDALRQASVYEEMPPAQPVPKPPYVPHSLNFTRSFHPSGYELGGFGGGPGDRPWQVPWASGYDPQAFAGVTGVAPPQYPSPDYALGSASLPVTPTPGASPTHLMSQPTPPQGSDPGAFGGAGLGGYNEGAFTLGPFFGHSVNYSVPPHTPGGASALPGGFRGRGPRGYQRSDERIREDVCERLLQDDYLDASDIEVSVKAGEVALNGTVPNRHAKRRAEDLVDLLSGVEHVQNNLRVKRR